MIHQFMQMVAQQSSGSGGGGGGGITPGTFEYGWTSTDSHAVNNPGPINTWYRRTISQTLYTAAELTADGVPSGATFNNITWHVVNANDPSRSVRGFNCRIFHTNSSTGNQHNVLTGTTKTLVYSDGATTDFTLTESTGDKTLTFTNGFTWNGTNNICVEYCTSQNEGGYTQRGTVRCVNNVTNGLYWTWTDSSGNSCSSYPSGSKSYKISIKMDYS